MEFEINACDFLVDNAHVYAIKAKRKKISILQITATNRTSAAVWLLLGSSKLTAQLLLVTAPKETSHQYLQWPLF